MWVRDTMKNGSIVNKQKQAVKEVHSGLGRYLKGVAVANLITMLNCSNTQP